MVCVSAQENVGAVNTVRRVLFGLAIKIVPGHIGQCDQWRCSAGTGCNEISRVLSERSTRQYQKKKPNPKHNNTHGAESAMKIIAR